MPRALVALLALSAGLDAITFLACYAVYGIAFEANPIARDIATGYGIPALLAVKALSITPLAILTALYARSKFSVRLLAFVGTMVGLSGAASNLIALGAA